VQTPRLLLVDDHPENLVAFESLLEDFEVELLQARSGDQALNLLLHHEVALVVLDIQMPEMDGYEVASLMGQTSHTRDIPVIFVTAINRDIDHMMRGYELGAVDFLTKPIEPLVFRSKVRVFLELDRKTRELEHSHQALEQSLAEVRHLKNYNETLLNSIGEGILSLDADGRIRYTNPAARTLLGTDDQAPGRHFSEFLAPGEGENRLQALFAQCEAHQRWEGVLYLCRHEQVFPAEITATPFQQNAHTAASGISLVFADITRRKEHERELIQASERDDLTGLTNRRGFERLLQERLQRERHRLSLVFIDLDGFKPTNDELGHQCGDRVLQELAGRFVEVTRESDLVARVGGDEFCVLALLGNPKADAPVIANKLLAATETTVRVEDGAARVGASLGVAVPHSHTTADELVEAADQAMYQAKRSGGDTHRLVLCER
jgi:diguanylate cyclase (GGDEF)-like protein/PAS domain S-box-containing protein